MANQGSILIVDDSSTFIEAANAILSDEGYEVMGAPDMGQLMESLQFFNPDLVLVDENMPDILGHDLVGYLRDALKVEVPVVLISSMEEMALAIHAHCSHAGGFIRKTSNVRNLTAEVRRFMSQAKSRGSSRGCETARAAAEAVPEGSILERLKAQHEEIRLSIMGLSEEIGHRNRQAIPRLLSEFKALTLRHLDLSDAELYPALERVAQGRDRTADLARLIRVNMARVSEGTRRFIQRHCDQPLDLPSLRRDWSSISIALGSRMETEAATVYPMFEKLLAEGDKGRQSLPASVTGF